MLRREVPATYEQSEALTTLATEQGVAQWVACGMLYHGWVLALTNATEVRFYEVERYRLKGQLLLQ